MSILCCWMWHIVLLYLAYNVAVRGVSCWPIHFSSSPSSVTVCKIVWEGERTVVTLKVIVSFVFKPCNFLSFLVIKSLTKCRQTISIIIAFYIPCQQAAGSFRILICPERDFYFSFVCTFFLSNVQFSWGLYPIKFRMYPVVTSYCLEMSAVQWCKYWTC